jgi:hypothetical protein
METGGRWQSTLQSSARKLTTVGIEAKAFHAFSVAGSIRQTRHEATQKEV